MAVVAGIVAAGGIVALHEHARFVYDGLTGPGLPLVILSAVCGLTALGLLIAGRTWGLRPAAVGAIVAV